ncbi:hypothetical protein [Pseudaestuariivita rosea]|uniref:hypothetical protein n=1 Tax=Pseudaestuariivita rosea TaxID=2763263 RepID=UPI001ABA60B9|nr:hypothetical protein [Pseudaestuariivita rosea]
MTMITVLVHDEVVRTDQDRIASLCAQLGNGAAEDVICRAMEELAVRLRKTEVAFQRDDHALMRKCARSMIAIADQVGLSTLARVAADVANCVDAMDDVALQSTYSRLIRVGDQSLTAVWDAQDLSL